MDMITRIKIQQSTEDVIAILDSAPVRRDLVDEVNISQLTNRVPIAHLAIERGFKSLITEAGKTSDNEHGLNKLYQTLVECDKQSAEYLGRAFEDTVRFYRINPKQNGGGPFKTLGDYLAKVGTDTAFNELRYWAVGEPIKGEVLRYIWVPIYRELLCALLCIFPPSFRDDTVTDRVERIVAEAMSNGRHIAYNSGNTVTEQSVHRYKDWLATHHTRGDALKEAVRRRFVINDDEFIGRIVREAYDDLRQSEDPAVQYFIHTLNYLPKGSEQRNPDAIPQVEWNKTKTWGSVMTPAGTPLGFIEKYVDGWSIVPLQKGLVHVATTAESEADAKHYLVNRLTWQVTVRIDGESWQSRLVSGRDPFHLSTNHELEFWDGNHGLIAGAQVAIEHESERTPQIVSVLEGTVRSVAVHRVWITGRLVMMRKDC